MQGGTVCNEPDPSVYEGSLQDFSNASPEQICKESMEHHCASDCQEFLDLTKVTSPNPALTVSLASPQLPGEIRAAALSAGAFKQEPNSRSSSHLFQMLNLFWLNKTVKWFSF